MPPPFRPANDACPPSTSALLVVACVAVALLASAGWVWVVLGVLVWH